LQGSQPVGGYEFSEERLLGRACEHLTANKLFSIKHWLARLFA